MHVNEIKIGKVETYDKKLGVGEIKSSNEIYTFTKNSLEDQEIEVGDTVRFRGEQTHQENIAYFIKKHHDTDTVPDMSFLNPKKYVSND